MIPPLGTTALLLVAPPLDTFSAVLVREVARVKSCLQAFVLEVKGCPAHGLSIVETLDALQDE